MKIKKLFINTIGCQMNVYDSEKVASKMAFLGYVQTADLEEADLVFLNTCTIREKAEQKAFSFLGRLNRLKQKKPGILVVVGGCVAQQEGEAILKRVPAVDLVIGTGAVSRIGEHVGRIEAERCRIVDVEMPETLSEGRGETFGGPVKENRVSAFVKIMTGCANYCTYCVVPSVRGTEISRRPENIVAEIESLVRSGVREISLLGQNVNRYGKKQGFCSFAELLGIVDKIDGVARIRFTTSHPKDLSEELMEAFAKYGRLCNHIHLPVQSGSNRVLKRMNRGYTREIYLEKVKMLRKINPEIAITTDIIVGFPGETEEDFEQTADLIERISFDSLFAFKYSDRPMAPARKFPGKIPESVKSERLKKVLTLQETRTIILHRSLIGQVQEVLVEGLSKKHRAKREKSSKIQWTGRTTGNIVVNLADGVSTGSAGAENLTGRLVGVKIEKALPHSIWGKPVYVEPETRGLKGETYAA